MQAEQKDIKKKMNEVCYSTLTINVKGAFCNRNFI